MARKARASGGLAEVFASEALVREYLFRTHCVARASVSLMRAALRSARSRAKRDPVAAGIVDYLRQHIEEERDHERWIARDLVSIGVAEGALAERVPPPSIALGVGAQYYWIQHFHPIALFGYMGVLESSAPDLLNLRKALRRSPVSPSAFRTLLWHAERDPEHSEELHECLEALPLLPPHEAVITSSAEATLDLLRRNGEELLHTLTGAASRPLARRFRLA